MTSLCPVALFTSGCLVEYLFIGFFTVYLWLHLNISRKGTRASSLPVAAVSLPLDKCLAPGGYSTNICCASCHRAGRKAPLGHIFLSFFVHQAAKGGTVKATSGFNAAEDAQTLRKAMKGLGKCPTGGEHPLCVPHPRVAQRALCPQANVCLTLRKHSGDKVTFQGKLEGSFLL